MPFMPKSKVERRLTRSVSPFPEAEGSVEARRARRAVLSLPGPGRETHRMAVLSKLTLVSVVNRPSISKTVDLRRPVVLGCCGKLDQGADQLILERGGIRLLAAYAGAHAALVASGLLALKAKHLRQRSYSSLFRRAQPDWARLHLLLALPSFRGAIQAALPAIDTRCAPAYNKENAPDRIENRLDRKRSVAL